MIDSHCHLADKAFESDLPEVVRRAQEAGVERALCILGAGDAGESAAAGSVRRFWPGIRMAVGVHPHHAGRFAGMAETAADAVTAAIEAEGASAIGEIGLDYHYDFSPPAVQWAVFEVQVVLARALGLPVVIHTRDAQDDTFRILREAGQGLVRGVFHCFTGDRAMARSALDLGFYISLAGIVTFPRSSEMREVAAFVPSDRLLIETDSPYLAPVPHRGKRNEPAFVARVLEQVAALRGTAVEPLRAQLVLNFDTFLARPASAQAGETSLRSGPA
jgi:TatD DNase family protein